MKTKEELKQLKEEVEKLGKKLGELNEDELNEVTGGAIIFGSALRENLRINGGAINDGIHINGVETTNLVGGH